VKARAPTLRQTVEGMALAFDREAAARAAAVIEFEAPSERPDRCHLVVEGGECRFAPGPASAPNLRVRTDGETWRRVGAGELDAFAAASSGALSVSGDLGLLAQLRRWFRSFESASLRADQPRPPGPIRLPAMAWLAAAFLPWKALWIGAAMGSPRAGAAVGLALSLTLLAYRAWIGYATFFEGASALTLAAFSTMGALSMETSGCRAAAIGLAALGVIWGAGAATRPLALTGEYARWSYIPALTGTALFRHPNVLITAAWSAGFLTSAGILLARCHGLLGTGVAVLLKVAVLGTCIGITRAQEGGAHQRQINDIDRRLVRLRILGGALAVAGATAVTLVLV
jgi:putative sterol carrier protein